MTHRAEAASGSVEWDWSAVRAICLREARRILGGSCLAEDAAQEAVVRAWRQRHSCRTPDRPAPWITAIARHEALRVLPHRHEVPYESDIDALWETEDPSRLIERLDLLQAIRSLERRDRRLLLGRYWQDLSLRHLAREEGSPASSVRVRLHRLRLRLRRALVEP
jgi:RNA polymerase sigma-70 factor (ECF subfamily)